MAHLDKRDGRARGKLSRQLIVAQSGTGIDGPKLMGSEVKYPHKIGVYVPGSGESRIHTSWFDRVGKQHPGSARRLAGAWRREAGRILWGQERPMSSDFRPKAGEKRSRRRRLWFRLIANEKKKGPTLPRKLDCHPLQPSSSLLAASNGTGGSKSKYPRRLAKNPIRERQNFRAT